jgi:predicted NUDIX family NTP pyrophosphohydrolase
MKETAGTLLYRTSDGSIEILLVHASGNYNKKSAWSIPKGLPEPGEELEDAARRETLEETGVVAGSLRSIGFIDYTKSKKRVHGFIGEAPADAKPYNASWEVDQASFHELSRAKEIIHHDQLQLIERLESILSS